MAGYAGTQYFLSRYDYLARVPQEADKLFRSKATLDAITLVIPWSFSVSDCCYYRIFIAPAASSHFHGRALPCLCILSSGYSTVLYFAGLAFPGFTAVYILQLLIGGVLFRWTRQMSLR